MFSTAFKAFSSNIISNYEISKQPTATAGPWQIFEAKKRSIGSSVSVFVFERKTLDVQPSGFGARASSTSIRKIQDEVVERLKKEASSLARLRHPSILQLVEPLEETRTGGLMFATEPVLASLSGALAKQDLEERTKPGRRTPDHGLEDAAGARSSQIVDLDELEIQKGLLQIAKGLEFLHESARLVHGNLTPDAIFINAKSDWKISGLAYTGPPEGVEGSKTNPQIALSEVLRDDPRIPRSVQLDLDYTSPDFVMDSNVNVSADIFSLGLVILALYNSPHKSPVETHGNQSTYRKIFGSASTYPTSSNDYSCTRSLPGQLAATLPRILARRPAQRLTAAEFQQSAFFDNILVNTLRFLDALPAKTAHEKAQFMRGLGRVLPQFPTSVLGKKVLVSLLEEMKDRELLALILQNVFQIIRIIPAGPQIFPVKVLHKLREVFLAKQKTEERDTGREAALLIMLENTQLISETCSAKEFKDDVLPIIHQGMESSTHSLVDASLQSIPSILPLLDFSTIKHDLFPVVAGVFSKTSSLGIKVRGLEALSVLCGGKTGISKFATDDLSGTLKKDGNKKAVSSLDKFMMQEKVLPLLKGIKTKEPAVMMEALKVLQQIGNVADTDFIALEMMPILWSFSLGPLLNLSHFQQYMELIKTLSSKIYREQTRKLQDLSTTGKISDTKSSLSSFPSSVNGTHANLDMGNEDDFERLVLGNRTEHNKDEFSSALGPAQKLTSNPPSFSWSTSNNLQTSNTLKPQVVSRSVTPDVSMSSFQPLQPVSTSSGHAWSSPQVQAQSRNPSLGSRTQPSQPSNYTAVPPPYVSNAWPSSSTTLTSSAPLTPSNIWQSPSAQTASSAASAFVPTLAAPPSSRTTFQTNAWQQQIPSSQPQAQQQKTGLDKYQSLL